MGDYMSDQAILELLPAVDVVEGRAVRLLRGEAGTEQDFGDPATAVEHFREAGAPWIHLVDLDAAFGRGSNYELLAQIISQAHAVKIELSGGIRTSETLQRALATGAARVNLGTAALEDPEWTARMIGEYGDRIAVGLDVRGEILAARGWTRDGGNLWEVVDRLNAAGCRRYVLTDVTRDGTLEGPNFDLLESLCAQTDAAVVASGGVSSLEDIRRLREMVPLGVEGAIIGKALYAGNFTIEQALAVAQG